MHVNQKKKKQLIFVCVCFVVILTAYLGFRYHMNHLTENAEDEEDIISVLDIDTSLVTEIGITGGEENIIMQKRLNLKALKNL